MTTQVDVDGKGVLSLFTIGGDFGSDGPGSDTLVLSFAGLTPGGSGVATNLSATNGGAITLFLTAGGVLEGHDTNNDLVFTIEIVGPVGAPQLQLTQFEAINHGADGNAFDFEFRCCCRGRGSFADPASVDGDARGRRF